MPSLLRTILGVAAALLAVALALAATQEYRRAVAISHYGRPVSSGPLAVLTIACASAALGAAWLLRII